MGFSIDFVQSAVELLDNNLSHCKGKYDLQISGTKITPISTTLAVDFIEEMVMRVTNQPRVHLSCGHITVVGPSNLTMASFSAKFRQQSLGYCSHHWVTER